ncbi:MAG TPA: beta-ketoacyl synthase N-terminal-like domain-containing protein [Pyrinomonadaceae bacterium]|nr:beta-ketoacyl synthase N-terminal-like domain-containing protein [Pyrinomonadaceae bacterium]
METSGDGFNIAIIGMSGRFPGAQSVAEFWENLREGRESISFFTEDELRESGVSARVIDDKRFVRAGAVIPGAFDFDAAFFDINRSEAELLDPQHRLFLECAWEALEEAGYDTEQYRGDISVFGGVSFHPYLWSNLWGQEADHMQTHLLKINLAGALTGRVSYKLNLKGPSLTLQSGCSTSLVAVHLACQSLLGYECDMALAGGVSVDTDARGYFVQEGALSPDGHTRAFDANAQGVVGGNGVGLVLLKRLEDALAEGDHIYAVIRGSAINNDGSLKIGYTAPSVQGQVRAIMAAQLVAGVPAETIDFIEAHGTGTPLGDQIELKALTEAFRATTDRKQFCAIGSVKTNVGHLDNAAGVTGLIKAALALHHRLLPASLHYESPNPEFDLLSSPFYVNSAATTWARESRPRRASVSSFGIGGTNAHAVLEEAPEAKAASNSRSWQLLTLSARTASALDAVTAQLVNYIKLHPEENLADIAYTCHLGRRAFNHRRMLVCSDREDAVKSLEELTPQRVFTAAQEPVNRPVAFMFPGGGAQHLQMGRGLYHEEQLFHEQLDLCAEILQPELGYDLRRVLYADSEADIAEASERLANPACAMAANFAIEYALASLFISWGVRPAAMIGHSFGEYVAATMAGVLTLEDALRLIVLRGKLFERLDEGAMLSVPLPEEEIEPLLGEQLSLAAINGPSRCVVSGPLPAIDEMEKLLGARKVSTSRLQANRAGHSRMVVPILKEFSQLIASFRLEPPRIPFISNVTGTWITPAQATDSDYWVSHLRQTVRFADGISELVKEPARILLEVGPGQILSSLTRRQLADKRTQLSLASLPDPQDKREDMAFLLGTLGKLWLAGVRVEWESFYREERRRRLSLPTYPFERQSFRRAPKQAAASGGTNGKPQTSKSQKTESPFYTHGWKRLPLIQQSLSSDRLRKPLLLFLDESIFGEALLKKLRASGRTAIAVHAGEAFARRSETDYTINPAATDDYVSLLREVSAGQAAPLKVVYQCSASSSGDDSLESELPEESRATGYSNLLRLFAASVSVEPSAPLELLTITVNAQEVSGRESLRPGMAMLAGASLALSGKHPFLGCRSVDVEALEDERVVEQLLAEIDADANAEPQQVAYRGSYRWSQTREAVATDDDAPKLSALREDGSYLIVGDAGDAGLELAAQLFRDTRARVVLATSPASAKEGLGIELEQERERIAAWESEIDESLSIRPIEGYAGLEESFNALCSSYIYAFLKSGRVELKKGASISLEELKTGLRIPDRFKHFLDLFLTELESDGVIKLNAGALEFLKDSSEVREPEELREELSKVYPQFASSFWLLGHCVRSYPSVFSGEVTPSSVLYPGGSYEMLQGLAQSSVETSKSPVYRQLLSRVISHLSERAGRKLRILEAGAGTGLLTEQILSALAGRAVEYHFTDIGRSFVLEAEKKDVWKQMADMRFDTLDISADPQAQGFENASYDIIIAFDVVQATGDVAKSLGNLKSLLAPGGAIFLLQTLKAFRWQHLTFGLSPGWWNFKDDPLRGASPVLSLSEWETALRAQGFDAVQSFPRVDAKESDAEFGMIAARRPAGSRTPEGLKNAVVEEVYATGTEGLRAAVELARHRLNQLNGVFYIAGALGEAPYLMERRRLHALEEELRETEADFCLLLAPDEAAMSRFMETFVYRQNRKSAAPLWLCSRLGGDGAAALRQLLSLKGITHLYAAAEEFEQSAAAASEALSAVEVNGNNGNGASPEHKNGHHHADEADETEQRLEAVWKELLGLKELSRDESFFDLGGDSLIALQLISRLRDSMRVDVGVADLFEHQTVSALADFIRRERAVPAAAAPETLELSPFERGGEELEALLSQLEQFSDEEVRSLLHEGTER